MARYALTSLTAALVVAGLAGCGGGSINGPVTVAAGQKTGDVSTVNGEVKVGHASKVSGSVKTVNGAVLLDSNADVAGEVANINGAIRLTSAHVGGGIKTVNADIDVGSGSHVDGGIHVERATMSTDSGSHVPRIVIGPNAMVNGGMTFEHKVNLYVSDSAQINGPIEGATPEKFSGDQPPN